MEQIPAAQPFGPGPKRIEHPPNPRLARMRFLSRLLDNSIPLPGGFRIGIDPVLGLLPAAGDFISGTLSLWIIYDAARLGLPWMALGRMLLNVLLDTAFGSLPIAGDLFDAAWKSNARNMQLVEEQFRPGTRERPLRHLIFVFAGALILLYSIPLLALYALYKLLAGTLGM